MILQTKKGFFSGVTAQYPSAASRHRCNSWYLPGEKKICEANVDSEAAQSTCCVVAPQRIIAVHGGVANAGLRNHMSLGRELSLSGLRSWHRFEIGSGTMCLCEIELPGSLWGGIQTYCECVL